MEWNFCHTPITSGSVERRYFYRNFMSVVRRFYSYCRIVFNLNSYRSQVVFISNPLTLCIVLLIICAILTDCFPLHFRYIFLLLSVQLFYLFLI